MKRRRNLEKVLIHTEGKIERKKKIRKEGRRMASFLESNSWVVGRKIKKGSVGIFDSWFYWESCHTQKSRRTRRDTWKDR